MVKPPNWTPVFEWPNLFDDWMSVLAKYAEEVESRKGQAIRLEPGGTKGADVLRLYYVPYVRL